jgi:hypothetical protein
LWWLFLSLFFLCNVHRDKFRSFTVKPNNFSMSSSSTGKRLTLVQRQQMLLEERGFSKPRTTSFAERQDNHLQKTGRANAVGASRKKAEMLVDNEEEGTPGDDAASVFSRFSHAPSLHPSMAGSMMSEACHPETIGAGDDTEYWDFQHRMVEKQDLGHRCRECRMPFTTIGDPLTERRGARLSMRYHAACFSGYADPRSQATSSHHVGVLAGSQLEAAPGTKAGKMRTSQHFESGSALRAGARPSGGGNGKTGMGLSMGSNGFGARSSKGAGLAGEAAGMWSASVAGSSADAVERTPGPGISEAALRQHEHREQQQQQQQQQGAGDDVGAAQSSMARLTCEPIPEHDG